MIDVLHWFPNSVGGETSEAVAGTEERGERRLLAAMSGRRGLSNLPCRGAGAGQTLSRLLNQSFASFAHCFRRRTARLVLCSLTRPGRGDKSRVC